MAEASFVKLTPDEKDTPYLTLTGELWGVFCEELGENWPMLQHWTVLKYPQLICVQAIQSKSLNWREIISPLTKQTDPLIATLPVNES